MTALTKFFDNFDGPAGAPPNPAYWRLKTGPHGAPGAELQCFTDRPENVSLTGDGKLAITAIKEPWQGYTWTSGWAETAHTVEPQYGLVEAYMKMPTGAGPWPAFWMVGNDHDDPGGAWPACGEIDVVEVIKGDMATYFGTIHGPKITDGSHWSQQGCKASVIPRPWYDLSKGFNIYGVLWEPDRFRFILNGVVVGVINKSDPWVQKQSPNWVFDHPFWLILSMGLSNGGWAGTTDPLLTRATMLVDWVRVTPLPI